METDTSEMKIKTVKKAIKEGMIKGRKTPLLKKVRLENLVAFASNVDHKRKQK